MSPNKLKSIKGLEILKYRTIGHRKMEIKDGWTSTS